MKTWGVSTTAVLALAAATVFSGCGGGGSSEPTFATLDAEAAPATAENGKAAVEVVVGGSMAADEIEGFLPIAAVSGGEVTGFDAVRFVTDPEGPVAKILSYEMNALNSAYEPFDCPYGGQITFSGSESATSMDMTMTFSSCMMDENVMFNGAMHVTAAGSNYGDTISYMHIDFPKSFDMSAEEMFFSIAAGSNMEVNYEEFGADSMRGRMTSSVQWNANNVQARYDNLTVDFSADYTAEPWIDTECYRAGRIYINNLGSYLDIDSSYEPNPECSDPFTYVDMTLVSGSTRLIGEGGAGIDVVVVGDDNVSVTDEGGTTLYFSAY